MVLNRAGEPLQLVERPVPEPGALQVRVRVLACAVCRTDVHVLDGELPHIALPRVPGHEIVGVIDACGPGCELARGTRVGIAWLGTTCGRCQYCCSGAENLCDAARFTGYHIDGGFAEYTLADSRYVYALDPALDPAHAAPLLCAGLIGYRALGMAGDGADLGIYGIGAAAHILIQVARSQGRRIYGFTRAGDLAAQRFARALGCEWVGPSDAPAPLGLDAAIIFAPAGELVPRALAAVRKGGRVICGGIHMSDIPSFPYALLWGERQIRSVANLTRRDAQEFLALCSRVPIETRIERFALAEANTALARVRAGQVNGAAVLVM